MMHLRAALFPRHFGSQDVSDQGQAFYVGRALDSALNVLESEFRVAFAFQSENEGNSGAQRAAAATWEFAASLPALRHLLASDAQAGYDGDPAATSLDEVIFSYAGMVAVIYHRIAHELYKLGVPLIPRIISELAHATTGIDIHPGAQIGGRFFIDHGTGVVIGETCRIGENVRLYQGVTLGAKSFPLDEHGHPIKGIPRHPVVEDDVTIYAGATVLGRITIGRGSSIGGNVWLTHSVPPHSHVSQAHAHEQLLTDGAGI
jgi:serine O-acetyltransferase